MERLPYDLEYDIELLLDESKEAHPILAGYMDQYIVDEINGLKIILRKDSIEAACNSVDPNGVSEDGRVDPEIVEILTTGSINPRLN